MTATLRTDLSAIGGVALVCAGAVSAELAWLHARSLSALGELCGGQAQAHCGWCGVAVGLVAAGAALIVSGSRHA